MLFFFYFFYASIILCITDTQIIIILCFLCPLSHSEWEMGPWRHSWPFVKSEQTKINPNARLRPHRFHFIFVRYNLAPIDGVPNLKTGEGGLFVSNPLLFHLFPQIPPPKLQILVSDARFRHHSTPIWKKVRSFPLSLASSPAVPLRDGEQAG